MEGRGVNAVFPASCAKIRVRDDPWARKNARLACRLK